MSSDREIVKPHNKDKGFAITEAESRAHLKSLEKFTKCTACQKKLKDSEERQIGLCFTHIAALEDRQERQARESAARKSQSLY